MLGHPWNSRTLRAAMSQTNDDKDHHHREDDSRGADIRELLAPRSGAHKGGGHRDFRPLQSHPVVAPTGGTRSHFTKLWSKNTHTHDSWKN